jgi:hypothetical protein
LEKAAVGFGASDRRRRASCKLQGSSPERGLERLPRRPYRARLASDLSGRGGRTPSRSHRVPRGSLQRVTEAMCGRRAAALRGVPHTIPSALPASSKAPIAKSMSTRKRHSFGYCSGPKTHLVPSAEISRAGVHRTCLQGAVDVSNSNIWYLRPQVRQLVQGATFGASSQGILARRRSSAIASSKVVYSPIQSA